MDIMCLMGLFPEEYQAEIEKDSINGMQNAANKLQWAIVRGLDQSEGVTVSITNSLYIGSYPKRYKTAWIPTFSFSHKPGATDLNAGFINLSGIKFFSRYFSAKKAVKKWAETPSNQEKVLLVYALTIPFCQIAEYVRNKFPEIKVCIVVPDLPEYMSPGKMQKDCIYRTAKKLEVRLIRHSIRKVNHFVLLTDTMKEWFERPVNYVVVEGIAGEGNQQSDAQNREKVILYAGGVNEEYGVIALAEAFIDAFITGWELHIYGSGPASEKLHELAKKQPAIKVLGRMPNSQVMEAQRKASILINPRENQVFTRYSFPSKIMEYMSSGTAVMAYKLDGMPDEYDRYYYRIRDGKDGLASSLREVMGLPDEKREEMGRLARSFVEDHKNPKSQCSIIIDLLSGKFDL